MKRRETIKHLLAASGVLVVLPSWAMEWEAGKLGGEITSFTPNEQELLASVADTIIPQGNEIGALSVGVDKFLQKLFDQCYEQDVQANIKTQLASLNASAQKDFGFPFTGCTQLQRQDLLMKMSVSAVEAESSFFELLKSETIRGFNTSKEVMVNYLNYKVIPGHYNGCVDLIQ